MYSSIDDTPKATVFGALAISQIDARVISSQGPSISQSQITSGKRQVEGALPETKKKLILQKTEQLPTEEDVPGTHDFMVLNSLNQSNRNSLKQNSIYA